MAEKRVSVRLAAVGGRQVRAELEGVGEAGKRGFGRLSQEMEAANRRLAGFARRVRVASAAAVAAATAAGVAMVRSGLQTVDAQAKLAASLDTTVASIQVLERAAELSGARFSEIEGGASRLTRRLSLFASDGGGPAAKAIEQLGLNAERCCACRSTSGSTRSRAAFARMRTRPSRRRCSASFSATGLSSLPAP